MRKLTYFILMLALFASKTNAQEMQGKVKYIITHNWVKKIAAVDYLSREIKDEYTYVWGNRAEYTLKSALYYSDKESRYEDLKDENAAENTGYSWRSDEYIIYRNLSEGKSYDLMRFLDKLYVIEDDIQNQNWKILNDMREIAGHICMNASWSDTIKGNKVIAWYALDIPIPIGPERFGGLPGMILEININNGAMVIAAQEIIITDGESVIEKPSHKKKVKQISESSYVEMLVQHINQCKKDESAYFWSLRY